MKHFILFAFAMCSFWGFSQCPFIVTLTGTGNNCLGTTLTVNSGSPLYQIVWYNGPTAVSTAASYNISIVAAGNGMGSAANQLNFTGGVAVDGFQNVYVSDVGNSRVQMWTPGATTGVTVAGGNGVGPASNQLNFPRGIAVDGSGNLYICDNNNQRVQKWAPGATFGVTVAGGNGLGANPNQLNSPMGIWVDLPGNIYIADQTNNRVQEWAPGATTGVTVAGGNGPGANPNQLNGAIGVSVDALGNVYVADQNNHRIHLWRAGQNFGSTVAGGNGPGSAANQLDDPNNVMVDASGNVYVADYINDRVQKWTPGATQGITVTGGNGMGPALNQSPRPTAVYVDPHGDIYVADSYNNRVEEWSYDATIDYQYTPATAGTYTATVTNSSGCTQTTNPVVVGSAVAPSVVIGASSTAVNTCTTVTFTATPANAGKAPSYQWQLNGASTGFDNPVYTNNHLSNNDLVSCTLIGADPCSATPNAVSNSIRMSVTGLPSVDLLSKAPLQCAGDTLIVRTPDSLSQIAWYNGGTLQTTTLATSPATEGITVAGGNGQGQAARQLDIPEALFIDGKGDIYVSDTYNNRVQKWTPGATSGTTVAGTTSINGSSAPNAFDRPDGIWVDAGGNIYVSDAANNRVQKWGPGAASGVTVAGLGGQGNGADQLNHPDGLSIDAAGNLYVADAGNSRVQKYAPGSASGITIAGAGGTPLHFPTDIFVDGSGSLYVTDTTNDLVLKFAPGSSTGVVVAGGNGQGPADNQLTNPEGIYVDANGNLYVADANNNRIQKWPPGATKGVTVAGGNGFGLAPNQLQRPFAVSVDGNGTIYIADTYNQRIQVWIQRSIIDTTYRNAAAGTYTVSATTSGGCTITSGPLVILPLTTPSVTIDASAASICAGSPVSFTASPANGGTTPSWQWQVNGKNVGDDLNTWTSDTLTNGAAVRCLLNSNAICTTRALDTSAVVILAVNPVLTPSVGITTPATTVCTGSKVIFTATAVNAGPAAGYQWMRNGTPVGSNDPVYSDDTFRDGDVITCTLTSNALCVTTHTAPSNGITLKVSSVISPQLSIAETAGKNCAGTPLTFTATPLNAGADPSYQWQVNGADQGSGSPVYSSSSLAGGDIISCTLIDNNAGCSPAASNSITLVIHPSPSVTAGQAFQMSAGQGITLVPIVTGDIATFAWSPAAGLSDTTIQDPVADPVKTTIYKLRVVSTDGCEASGTITVKVFTQLAIPGAFTPNGDGKNDVFYVLGSPPGTRIGDFSVFDRWGEKIFQVHDAPSGDPAFGWDGRFRGTPVAPGTYVYVLTLQATNAPPQVFRGTIVLVR